MNNGHGENEEIIDKASPKNKAKKSKINDDTALEIINLEFIEIEEWLRTESKQLKIQCNEIAEGLKTKKAI